MAVRGRSGGASFALDSSGSVDVDQLNVTIFIRAVRGLIVQEREQVHNGRVPGFSAEVLPKCFTSKRVQEK
jgi:hypothetical protein